ncbi:hypothetical protein [Chenggangzhangella methanolivorans]|nr:hypothetical protein [Chenggangzhangella methanolivorans]
MKTEDLISAIASDAASSPRRLRPAFWAALGLAALAAGRCSP